MGVVVLTQPLDPTEVRDYALDWTPQLGSNTISNGVWSVVSGGVTIVAQSFTSTGVIMRLTGGTANTVALLKSTVTLSDGESYEQVCQVSVIDAVPALIA